MLLASSFAGIKTGIKHIMHIRQATITDIPFCTELLAELFRQEKEFMPRRDLQETGLEMIINNPGTGTVLVAEPRQGDLAGMLVLLYTVSTALGGKAMLLEDMVVAPAWRRQGVGSALVSHACRYAAQNGFKRITLLTDPDNAAAHHLYERHGFRSSGMKVFRNIVAPEG
ncbi:GNAT family N-acetyltransferase [Prosthecochloris sp. CIB 2401]|nr:GNAT family N-acetyltransferase [Prosthecochloris sp. CIB 2401]ANT64889.1 TDP-fucosamine acetyltransferase [Prosthecochloris sp. CIB 2401]